MNTRSVLRLLALLAIGVLGAQTLVNPLLPSGADPWVTRRDGFYYYMNTTGNSLAIRKTRNHGRPRQRPKRAWSGDAPPTGPYSRDIWAPELHFLRGKWYIYFAADAGTNASHRIWVTGERLRRSARRRMAHEGQSRRPTDRWAIDATVFEQATRVSTWSGPVGRATSTARRASTSPNSATRGRSRAPRVRISTPEYPWEKVGDLKPPPRPRRKSRPQPVDPLHVDVNEGPEILRHGGRIFLVYSAAGCWTDYYSLGMLTADGRQRPAGSRLVEEKPLPVFWQSPQAGAYGTGHGSFFPSPDGSQSWMLYHANPEAGQGCGRQRSPRAQPFTWKPDGTPDFGRPVAVGAAIPRPPGE